MKATETSKGQKSSMRLSLLWVIAMAGLMIIGICASIIVKAVNGNTIDWSGISMCISAVGLFTAPAFGFKAWQVGKEPK